LFLSLGLFKSVVHCYTYNAKISYPTNTKQHPHLVNLAISPTRVTKNSVTQIDIIVTNKQVVNCSTLVLDLGYSDNLDQILKINITISAYNKFARMLRYIAEYSLLKLLIFYYFTLFIYLPLFLNYNYTDFVLCTAYFVLTFPHPELYWILWKYR
jgi:hypothetical protein